MNAVPRMTCLIVCLALCPALIGCGGGGNDGARLEQNKTLVRGYFDEVINQHRFDAWDRYFAPQVRFNFKDVGRTELETMFGQLRVGFPDLQMVIEDQIAEGDKVVSRVTFRGTHQGVFMNRPPTGRTVGYMGITIDRIENGKIVEMWHEADIAGLLAQIQPPPAPPE